MCLGYSMWELNQSVAVGRMGVGGYFGLGSNQIVVKNRDTWEALCKIASICKRPSELESIENNIKYTFPEIDESIIHSSISTLIDNNFLIESKSFSSEDRYSRSHLYYSFMGSNPEKVQAKLSNSTVAILGCGGIGNHVSAILASSGVGKLMLVDKDHIEISNLTRQILFTESDVNDSKIDVLERELLKRNNKVEIEKLPIMIKQADDLSILLTADLLVLSADQPTELIDWVNSWCVKNSKPYINVGYINDISMVGPFYIPGKTGCFRCNEVAPYFTKKDTLKKVIDTINSGYRPATFPAINGVSACYAAGDVIKYLGGFGQILSVNKRIGIHSSDIKIETQSLSTNKECNICGHLQIE